MFFGILMFMFMSPFFLLMGIIYGEFGIGFIGLIGTLVDILLYSSTKNKQATRIKTKHNRPMTIDEEANEYGTTGFR